MMRIEAVYLPEFELAVSLAMCRNPQCVNFGVRFEGELGEGQKQVYGQRYAIEIGTGPHGVAFGTIRCRKCGQVSELTSNRAVRPVSRYFLGLSLPFADCPNETCVNHGMNLFEHWQVVESDPPIRYRREREQGARCVPCAEAADSAASQRPAPIALGTARRTSYSPATRLRWAAILDSLRSRRPGAGTVDLMGISAASYYGSLRRIAARLRDYQAFRNSQFWNPDLPRRGEPAALYTDVVEIPCGAPDGRRAGMILRVIVSAVALGGCVYVLAAHPYFLPKSFHPKAESPAVGQEQFAFQSERACLKELSRSDPLHHDGWFIRSPYAELAHFLVVRKMLDGFAAVRHYMQSAGELFPAAAIAWRDRVLAGRPETVRSERRRNLPPRTVEFVLLEPSRSQQRPRIRRMTRLPGRTAAGLGEAAAHMATLQPLHSIFDTVGVQRGPVQPASVNSVGRGPRNRYYRPEIVYDELALCLLAYNFAQHRPVFADVPARAIGLLGPGDVEPDLVDVAWRFRLGTRHAERISLWKRD